MATAPMNTAAKVAKLRKMAEDKSLPQDVRNQYLDDAVKLEEKSAKGAGVKLAKGGSVAKAPAKKPAPKKMAVGGDVQMAQARSAPMPRMAQAVSEPMPSRELPAVYKPPVSRLPMPPMQRSGGKPGKVKPTGKTMMAKGGSVAKAQAKKAKK